MSTRLAAAAFSVAAAARTAPASQDPSFHFLPLPAPGWSTTVKTLSDNGETIGYTAWTSAPPLELRERAFLWTPGTNPIEFHPQPGYQGASIEFASPGAGAVLVRSALNTGQWLDVMFALHRAADPTATVPVPVPLFGEITIRSLTDDGAMMLGHLIDFQALEAGRASRWIDGFQQLLPPPLDGIDSTFSSSAAIAHDGEAMLSGTVDTPTGRSAFLWTSNRGVILARELPGGDPVAGRTLRIAQSGDYVFGAIDNAIGSSLPREWCIVRWPTRTVFSAPTELGRFTATSASIAGCSANGDTAFVVLSNGSDSRSFRWTASGGMHPIEGAAGQPGSIAIRSVDSDGRTAVGVQRLPSETWPRGIIWTAPTGTIFLDHLLAQLNIQPAGLDLITPEIISMDGSAAAGWVRLSSPAGFRSFLIDLGTPCRADYDGSRVVDILDVFEFLRAWFGSELRADADENGVVSLEDIFVFLTAYFTPCGH